MRGGPRLPGPSRGGRIFVVSPGMGLEAFEICQKVYGIDLEGKSVEAIKVCNLGRTESYRTAYV